MDIIHVAIWLHDHGLLPRNPQVEDIERWAHLVRELPPNGEHRDEDGDWNTSPRNLQGVLDKFGRQLADIQLQFQYPPRAPSAHARSWSTASEIAVDQLCLQTSVNRIFSSIANDEEDETEMEIEASTSNPDATNPGKDTA